ncbi:hypothetical protein JTB14_007913 [Gonioctena quinquepunctata]|nr:hypothetical protein JTB14_007913 [Gonioctena quinquepunctata]
MSTIITRLEKLVKILMMLTKEFSHFQSAWDSEVPDQKILNNLISRLLLEEEMVKHRQGNNTQEGSGLTAQARINYSFQSEKDNFNTNRNKKLFCNFCKKRCHVQSHSQYRKKKEQNQGMTIPKGML